jgi:multiple sugar transport system permease protein
MLKKISKNFIPHLIILFIGLAMTYPLFWMVSSSLKPSQEIFSSTKFLPQTITGENYIQGWFGFSGYSFTKFYMNSFFVTFMCVFGVVVSSSMAAFAFSRLKFSFKSILFSIMMLTLMLPKHVKIIPQYIIFNKLHWINTYLPLVVPAFFGVQGFFIFLLVQYMRTLPNSLFEAAEMDGCNVFDVYGRIILPLSLPALITTAILTFMWTWNDFFSQLLYLSEVKRFTISIALRMFVDTSGGSSWGAMFAMSVLSLIPLFVLFILFQNYIVDGITSGSVKG